MQLGAKEFLESELERLQEILNLNEVHRLTRKYKFSLIIEQVIFYLIHIIHAIPIILTILFNYFISSAYFL